jgi:hypothetical protein
MTTARSVLDELLDEVLNKIIQAKKENSTMTFHTDGSITEENEAFVVSVNDRIDLALSDLRKMVEEVDYKRDWEDEPIGALYGYKKAINEVLEMLK